MFANLAGMFRYAACCGLILTGAACERSAPVTVRSEPVVESNENLQANRDSIFSAIAKDGIIRDANTARRVADAVLMGMYAQTEVAPAQLTTSLVNQVWRVAGKSGGNGGGHVVEIEIAREDGNIQVQRDGVRYNNAETGIVAGERAAVGIAEAVLAGIYGADVIDRQRPFVATLNDSLWTVTGTKPPNMFGGVAAIQIVRNDGRIRSISHGL